MKMSREDKERQKQKGEGGGQKEVCVSCDGRKHQTTASSFLVFNYFCPKSAAVVAFCSFFF